MPPATHLRRLPIVAALSLTFLFPASLLAQRADFLFGRPAGTVAFMAGYAQPGESSELFAFARDEFTIKRGAFASPFVMLDVGIRLTERLDLALGAEYAGSAVDSEMRDWVTQDDGPIPQTTRFKRARVTAGVKAYLLPRGRRISDYAWIPNLFSPYAGGGIGATWYEFMQDGEFVNYETLYIVEDRLTTKGSGLTPYAVAGLDVTLSKYFLIRAEARHYWGTGTVDQDVYQDFNRLDLSGFRGSIGVAFRLAGRAG